MKRGIKKLTYIKVMQMSSSQIHVTHLNYAQSTKSFQGLP